MTFMGIVILVQMAQSFGRAGPSGFKETSLSRALNTTDVEPENGKMDCQCPGGSLETIPADFHFEFEQAVLNNHPGFWLPYPNYNPDSRNINLYFLLCSELPNAPITTTETVRFIVTCVNLPSEGRPFRRPCYIILVNTSPFVNFLQQMLRYRCLRA